jgi:hypothetical protein
LNYQVRERRCWVCSMHGREEKCIQVLVGEPILKNTGGDGRIIIKFIIIIIIIIIIYVYLTAIGF